MMKVKSNWGYFLERLLTAVILTGLLRVYQQALPLSFTLPFSLSNYFPGSEFMVEDFSPIFLPTVE